MTTTNLSNVHTQLIHICQQLNCTIVFNSGNDGNQAETKQAIDATWLMRSSFVILTMQSGFALLEAGFVGQKNLANIMVKNTADVAIGGLFYWLIGYGLSFGEGGAFAGTTHFATHACCNQNLSGMRCTQYFFQFSFASTANTILSGAVAERMNLLGYMLLSAANEISYCLPVRWTWSDNAWLLNMGFYDLAGTCVVHLNGGISALIAAIIVGPRQKRWTSPTQFGLISPVTALTGTLLLWWAWFSFNCGSTLGTSDQLWKLNALVAINTLNGSTGGTCMAIILSMLFKKGLVDVTWLINGVLGGLVAITGICSVTSPLESLLIGAVGALISIGTGPLLERLRVDDPVGVVPVHFAAAIWGTLAVGIFGKNDTFGTLGRDGLVHGGGFDLLQAQCIGIIAISIWSGGTTALFMIMVDLTVGLRMTHEDEEIGADESEHGIIGKVDGLRGLVPRDSTGLRRSDLLRLLKGQSSNAVGAAESTENCPAGFLERRRARQCLRLRKFRTVDRTPKTDMKMNAWVTKT